jgi:hypothetical protein
MKLPNPKTVKSFGLLLFALLLSYSCSDPSVDVKQNEFRTHNIDTSDRLHQYITTGLGFDPASVKDYGDMYVADGDVMFNKRYFVIPDDFGKFALSAAPNAYAPGSTKPDGSAGRTNQTVASYTQRISRSTQRQIQVSINANVPSSGKYNIRPNITEAINKWNSVSCSEIKFILVTGRRGSLEISDDQGKLTDTPNALVLAQTDFPSGGSVGYTILLNIDKIVDNTATSTKKTGIIMHELGHAIGFRHTNWELSGERFSEDVQVPQTPAQTDASSVFNVGIPSGNDFSTNDRLAIKNAYPAFSNNSSCLAPFYYYWSSTHLDAFYTTQLTEKGGTYWNFSYQKIECFMNTSQQSGTVPLYRMYSETNTDHAYKTSNTSFSTYTQNGIAGYIYTASGGGRAPLYEFYSSKRKDYAYTVNPIGFGTPEGYVQQGIVGYVYTSR